MFGFIQSYIKYVIFQRVDSFVDMDHLIVSQNMQYEYPLSITLSFTSWIWF